MATITGDTGGIFTSSSGLVIDSLTGEIDLAASAPGNHQVTYIPPNSSSSGWQQIGQDIDGEAAHVWSGWSVSLSSDGSIVAIGSSGYSDGDVRIYENNGGTWQQIGQAIDGEAANDLSGSSVSLSSDGSIVAIGATVMTRMEVVQVM